MQLKTVLWAGLIEAADMIESPDTPPDRKLRAIAALSTAAGVYAKLLELSDFDTRLAELERLVERNGHHGNPRTTPPRRV